MEERSLLEAFTHTVETGRRLVDERFELAKVELRALATEWGRAFALAIVIAVLAIGVWFALTLALIEALFGEARLPVRLLVFGLFHGVIAGVLLTMLRRRIKKSPRHNGV